MALKLEFPLERLCLRHESTLYSRISKQYIQDHGVGYTSDNLIS